MCPCDADTTIIKVALDSANGTPVTVYSDVTDVLCLLVHHVKVSTNPPDIFITNMTRAKNSQRLCYRIEDLISELDDMVLSYLLFTHAFTGISLKLLGAVAKDHATDVVLAGKQVWLVPLHAKSVTVLHAQIGQLILIANWKKKTGILWTHLYSS